MSVILGLIFTCVLSAPAVLSLECYRCNSTNNRECLEKFLRPSTLKPDSCSDVPDAKYCIKTTGFYQGVVGDQRFCSAKDLGNWCEYVQNEEDGREYRTCVYTCSTDACNSANQIVNQQTVFVAILFLVAAIKFFQRL